MHWIWEKFGWQQSQRNFEVMIMAKGPEENLLTVPAFAEMIELNELIFNTENDAQKLEYVDGELIKTGEESSTSYGDICSRHIPVELVFAWKKNTVDKDVSLAYKTHV